MLALTESAVAAVSKVLSEDGTARGLRIAVASGGCSGFRYSMGLESEEYDGDTVLTFGDVTVFVDSDSAALLNGVQVDFVDNLSGSGFTFSNPNATSSCGCGKSFC